MAGPEAAAATYQGTAGTLAAFGAFGVLGWAAWRGGFGGGITRVGGRGVEAMLSILVGSSAIWRWREMMPVVNVAKFPSVVVVSLVITVVLGVDPSELTVFAIERFCCGALLGGRGS